MRTFLVALIMGAALAACGSGGSSGGGGGGGVISPTNPPVNYAVKIKFVGGASLHTTLSVGSAIHVQAAPLDAVVNANIPIELSVSPSPGTAAATDSRTSGVATVIVDPSPIAYPAVQPTATGIPMAITTLPYPSPQPTDPPRFNVTQNGIGSPMGGGMFTAAVAAPISLSQSVAVAVLPRSLIACGNQPVLGKDSNVHTGDQVGALRFLNGVAQSLNTTTGADLYADGPKCSQVGFLNGSEAGITYHFPFGATLVSSANSAYSTLLPAAWANTFTTLTFSSFSASLVDPNTPTDIILLKTGDGHVVKFAILGYFAVGSQDLVWTYFLYQEDGFAVDGF